MKCLPDVCVYMRSPAHRAYRDAVQVYYADSEVILVIFAEQNTIVSAQNGRRLF